MRNECSHPCDRLRGIGKCEFDLLLVGLEVSDIKLVPLSIVSRDGGTSSPIEVGSIVATKSITILDAETEHNRLIGSNLEVELGDFFVSEFIDQIVCTARNDGCEVKPCRDRYSGFAHYAIIASDGST